MYIYIYLFVFLRKDFRGVRVAGLVAHAAQKRGVHALSAKSAVAIGLATAGSQARMRTPLMQRARPGLRRAHLDKCFRWLRWPLAC